MKKALRLPFIVHALFLITALQAAAQVKFTTVSGSKEVGLNEYLQLDFIVENATSIDRLTPPSFPGFRIIEGPSQSSGMTVINGNVSQYKGLSYVLQPVKTGKFTIQGATASIDGNSMRSNPVTVTVNAAGSGSANNAPNRNVNPFFQQGWPDPTAGMAEESDKEYILKPGENAQEKIRKNLFVKVQVDKSSCYVGEPIVATYKLYSRLRSESRVTKRPSLNGFSVYDMVDPNSDVSSVEKVNGKPFTVHIIRKAQLIPLQAGTVDLDPMEIENTIHFLKGSRKSGKSGNRPRDPFDAFEDDDAVTNWVDENATLDTKPLSITVKPLPETSKPSDYNGAVGQFTIQASLENKNLASRDESTLQVTIRGGGNLPVINAPQVRWPAGLETFDPVAKEEVDHTTVPMSGLKIFKYVFSPKTPGVYIIPCIDFSYFDPASQTYRTIHTDSLTCEVGPAIKRPSPLTADGASPGSSDQSAGGLVSVFVHLHLEWIFAVLILSALAIYLWRQNLRMKKPGEGRSPERSPETGGSNATNNNSAGNANAPTVVSDPLSHARLMFAETNYKGFYREVNRALWKAMGDMLNLPSSKLNKNNMMKALEARGWDPEPILLLENTLSECEINIYTPVYDTYNMQKVLQQADELMNRL